MKLAFEIEIDTELSPKLFDNLQTVLSSQLERYFVNSTGVLLAIDLRTERRDKAVLLSICKHLVKMIDHYPAELSPTEEALRQSAHNIIAQVEGK